MKATLSKPTSNLTYQEGYQAKNNLGLAEKGFSIEWMIDVVANEQSETPVISAVLEKIHYGHGRMGETVNKNGLQQSFDVVQSPTRSSNTKE